MMRERGGAYGSEYKLVFGCAWLSHSVMENRTGATIVAHLVVKGRYAEREAVKKD